jgi:hypothetical protein
VLIIYFLKQSFLNSVYNREYNLAIITFIFNVVVILVFQTKISKIDYDLDYNVVIITFVFNLIIILLMCKSSLFRLLLLTKAPREFVEIKFPYTGLFDLSSYLVRS